MDTQVHRVFIGGLFPEVTDDDIKQRFTSFGQVGDVSIVQKKDVEGQITKTFGYINLETTTQKLNKCFAVYGGTKWKGHQLKVQVAKEDFMAKLKKERDEPPVVVKKKKKKSLVTISPKTYTDVLNTAKTMKKIVPGTLVEGENNWVIGKFGRPLPVVNIAKGKKTMKVDPSKFCHCLKRINLEVSDTSVNAESLTWSLDDETLVPKKKKRKKLYDGEGIDRENLGDSFNMSYEEEGSTSLKKKKKKKVKNEEENVSCITENVDVSTISLDLSNIVESSNASLDGGVLTLSKKKKKKKVKNEEEIVSNITENVDFSTINLDLSNIEESSNASLDGGVLASSKKKKKKKVKNEEEIVSNITENVDVSTINLDTSPDTALSSNTISNEAQVKTELGPSIIQQLMAKKTATSNPSENNISSNKDDSLDESGPNVNMFDFDFSDVFTKKTGEKSFLASLISGIEIREGGIEKEDIESGTNDDSNAETQSGQEDNGDDSGENDSDSDDDMEEGKEDLSSVNTSLCDSSPEKEATIQLGKTEEMKSVDVMGKMEQEIGKTAGELAEGNVPTSSKTKLKDKTSDEMKPEKSSERKTKAPFISKQEKHTMSEEMRTKSLAERQSKICQDKSIISKALKGVDQSHAAANKIVFSDSEGSEAEDTTFKEAIVMQKDEKEMCEKDENENSDKGSKSDGERKLLFSSEDEDEDDPTEDEITVKPQFQGKEGEKLFKLQQRFNDERFKLDKRFAEEDENVGKSDDVETGEKETLVDEEDDLVKEKEKNLSVLNKILGKTISSEKKSETSSKDTPFERYDPGNVDHEKYEVKPKTVENNLLDDDGEKKKDKSAKLEHIQLPEVSKETYHDVTNSIKDLFSQEESASFSFFGNSGEMEVDAPENAEILDTVDIGEDVMNTIENDKIEPFTSENLNTIDNDGDDDTVAFERDNKEVSSAGTSFNQGENKCYLLLRDDDPRFEIGRKFVRSEELQVITEQWKAVRRKMTDDYKQKHKDAIRRIRKMKERKMYWR